MIELAAFVILFVVSLIAILIYMFSNQRQKPTTVPGPEPSDSDEGNMLDIDQAGGMPEYLEKLHEEYGPIASFWLRNKLVVSIASPEYFAENSFPFDRPPILFDYLKPLIGEHSMHFQNGAEGRQRRILYEQCFSQESCHRASVIFTKLAENMATKWESLPEHHNIPAHQYMMAFAVKGIVYTNFGEYFRDEQRVLNFVQQYDVCMTELQGRLGGGLLYSDNDPRARRCHENLEQFKRSIREMIDMQNCCPSPRPAIFLDCLLDTQQDPDVVVADALTYMISGFHTTGNFLTWALYYLAENPEVQKSVVEELNHVFGIGDFDCQKITKLKYLHMVLDETLRCGIITPYAARVTDVEITIGGHVIPKETPIIHAIGVVMKNQDIWNNPEKFDPNRFLDSEHQKYHPFAFQPFGFAGKRKCPGYRFSYMAAMSFLAVILRRFEMSLAENQVPCPKLGYVAKPADEIWISVKPRVQ